MASYPTAPTAEMPMPGGATQLRLIQALESNNSLYELCQELPRLAKELKDDPGFIRAHIGTSRTCEDIERDHLAGWDMVILLHSMAPGAIKSIIYGTLAHDAASNNVWYHAPAAIQRGAGVYVIGLARKDMGGKFLNEGELQQLIEGLERYVRGWIILKSGQPGTVLTQTELQDKAWVKTVDNACQEIGHLSDGSSARFMPRSGEDTIVPELIEALRRRITNMDPTQRIRHIQSPLYVGCSVDLRERLSEYDPKRGFRRVNRPLGLTFSVLEALKIRMQLVRRVVIRTWKPEQLALGERLVTTLSGSMVCQSGFNATQAGANTGGQVGSSVMKATLNSGWNSVECSGYLNSNVTATMGEMDRRESFLDELSKATWSLYGIELRVEQGEELQRKLGGFKAGDKKGVLQELERYQEVLKRNKEEIQEIERVSKILRDILNII